MTSPANPPAAPWEQGPRTGSAQRLRKGWGGRTRGPEGAEELTSGQRLEKSISGRRGDRPGQPPLHPPITKHLLSSPGRGTWRPRDPAAPLPALRLAKSTMLPWDFSRSRFPWSLEPRGPEGALSLPRTHSKEVANPDLAPDSLSCPLRAF